MTPYPNPRRGTGFRRLAVRSLQECAMSTRTAEQFGTEPSPTPRQDGLADGSMDDALTVFLNMRRRLFGVAYRISGSAADAEDIVQSVWLKWQMKDRSVVRDAP